MLEFLYKVFKHTITSIYVKWSEVTQSCLTLCDPIDCNLLCSSVHRILQARILEWVAIPFPKGSSWPRDQTQVSCIAGKFFSIWTSREASMHFPPNYFIFRNRDLWKSSCCAPQLTCHPPILCWGPERSRLMDLRGYVWVDNRVETIWQQTKYRMLFFLILCWSACF